MDEEMKIQCPLIPESMPIIESLVKCGADEFFFGCGTGDERSSSILSRRPGARWNFSDVGALKEVISVIKGLSAKTFLAINEHFYPESVISMIINNMERSLEYGVDGFIVTDLNLFIEARKRFPDSYFIASTGLHVLNSGAVSFYKEQGFNRIILPRQLVTDEIKSIAGRHPDMDFEIFIKNENCPNIDGLCSYPHIANIAGRNSDACRSIRLSKAYNSAMEHKSTACGICDIHDLKDLHGITLKICGRPLPPEMILNDVRFLKKVLSLKTENLSRAVFVSRAKMIYSRIYGTYCGGNCYREIL